ncbi:DUF427 domain-containing protein [Tessaracoccus flavus]|uniref:Uncharacterized protein n=1 Tax=Tessaracoccus flavus TaxID=1610493 RepID=A0A1Q2CBV4_9ACTN|nr:DUF427 domain-containing protein [Tessaracoccus flavus]AQP43588.1 hypothetical protein RPIT_01095 [Tessaracoccus flavus]SDY87990.1 Uncharacterized conserved protein, DUF427 family [Tessaracoccus flavus]
MVHRPKPDPVGPGQESVWDYPRPPTLRRCSLPIEVILGGEIVFRGNESLQVLETSHPPTYYLPRSGFVPGALTPAPGGSFCEWKGAAKYLDVHGGEATASAAAWYYPTPTAGFADLVDHVALYPGAMDACFVDGERVIPQPGGFYGGWITSSVAGPFKGTPGSMGW